MLILKQKARNHSKYGTNVCACALLFRCPAAHLVSRAHVPLDQRSLPNRWSRELLVVLTHPVGMCRKDWSKGLVVEWPSSSQRTPKDWPC